MERYIAAAHALCQRALVVEIARHRLCPEVTYSSRRSFGARKRAHAIAVRDQIHLVPKLIETRELPPGIALSVSDG